MVATQLSIFTSMAIKTTPEEMKQLAAAPSQRVLCADEKLHAVHDLPSDTFGYAIYQTDARFPEDGPLKAISEPCFLMMRRDGGKLHCSLAFTKFKDSDPYPDVRIKLTLEGQWAAPDASRIETAHAGKNTDMFIRPGDNTPMKWTLRTE